MNLLLTNKIKNIYKAFTDNLNPFIEEFNTVNSINIPTIETFELNKFDIAYEKINPYFSFIVKEKKATEYTPERKEWLCETYIYIRVSNEIDISNYEDMIISFLDTDYTINEEIANIIDPIIEIDISNSNYTSLALKIIMNLQI